MKLLGSLSLVLVSSVVACAAPPHVEGPPALASANVPAAPVPVASREAVPEAAPEPADLPTECADPDAKVCVPEREFTQRLCGGIFPEVALTMFGKSQPWTRAYLTGDTDAWNASGGKVTRSHMIFDEEVLVMAKRERAGGIVVTGAAQSYDVLRWDGTCVSLEGGEMTFKKPPAAKSAPIPWRRLSEATRNALLATPKVQASQKLVEKACNGDSPSPTSAKSGASKCDKADAAFDRAIVDYVRGGGELPVPARRP